MSMSEQTNPAVIDDEVTLSFQDFLDRWTAEESVGSDDVLSTVLPLFRQVRDAHEAGKVAPLDGLDDLHVTSGQIWFHKDQCEAPKHNAKAQSIGMKSRTGLDIVETLNVTSDDETGLEISDASSRDSGEGSLNQPVWLPDYANWETELGHHDELTDIFSLGIILASVAGQLDMREKSDRDAFTAQRANFTALNPRIHPVIARAIERMTELYRSERAPDLNALILALENYRKVSSDFEADLGTTSGFETKAGDDRRSVLLRRLRARLYDLTRRNRLLYSRPTSSALNMTEASVPLVMNLERVSNDDLILGQSPAMKTLLDKGVLNVGDFVRFDEMAFAPSVLSRLRLDSNRDVRDYGFSNLRLVPVFLRWYDLKLGGDEQISSPLLLLSVKITKQKGVRDSYILTLDDTKADVNPALSFLLDNLYGIKLPTSVDLSVQGALEKLHASLAEQIMRTEPAVTLTWQDKPQLRILKQKVRRRLDKFQRRRQATGSSARRRGDISYSYTRKKYDPLGAKLFRQFVRIPDPPRSEMFSDPKPIEYNMVQPSQSDVTERSSTNFQTTTQSKSRFHWSFDLCSVTLANFNYRKMSLVRDYDGLLDGEIDSHDVFEGLFDDNPKPLNVEVEPVELAQQYLVVPADPTQEKAVLQSRSGQSYVIQGPPGTGKSQTITNLIADYVSQGKRVLFVCEKRAALDVVFNRLRGAGLAPLAALMHDSQGDKREFLDSVESIYTEWLERNPDRSTDDIQRDRAKVLETLTDALEQFAVLTDLNTRAVGETNSSFSEIVREAFLHTETDRKQLSAYQKEQLPSLKDWQDRFEDLKSVFSVLGRAGDAGSFARLPERLIAKQLWSDESLISRIEDGLRGIAPLLEPLEGIERLLVTDIPEPDVLVALEQSELAVRLAPVFDAGKLRLFDVNSAEAADYRAGLRSIGAAEIEAQKRREKAEYWTDDLNPQETAAALAIAQKFEGKFLSFLSGTWRRVKTLVKSRTYTDSMALPPSVTDMLTDLHRVHEAVETVDNEKRKLAQLFGYDDFDALAVLVTQMERRDVALGLRALPLVRAVISGEAHTLIELSRANSHVTRFVEATEERFEGTREVPLSGLKSAFQSLGSNTDRIRRLQPVLSKLSDAPDPIWRAIRTIDADMGGLTLCIINEALERSLNAVPEIDGLRHDSLLKIRGKLADGFEALRALNAEMLVDAARGRFLRQVELGNSMVRDVPLHLRDDRKAVNAARKMLEHEFKKQRNLKSPRELLAGDSGYLLKDLKSVWLMSPLSVADILPLVENLFEVVIFDEASQIPLEDAIPTLFRAPQCIVVGDEKQLPPTNFFSSSASDDDDEVDESLDFELNEDSFLAQAAERLPSTMLGWHYRSRSEALIGFCNQAFYNGRLLTAPSVTHLKSWPAINATESDAGLVNASALLERPISFHFIENGIYSDRRNQKEADYIAAMVEGLLTEGNEKTIGIVAFSEAQQGMIDAALDRRADRNPHFAKLLEAERDRCEGEEYIGLFVKNLENVQGDERDIIILSVCYGPDPQGQMRMNFGPINKAGGEKRLNVIFSRAKERMAVVSSIKGNRITNDFNPGAATLKNYLLYVEALSCGAEESALQTLTSVSTNRNGFSASDADSVVQDLSARLRAAGLFVRTGMGMSGFKIDLAIRRDENSDFELAILLDQQKAGPKVGARERLFDQPELLHNFQWNVVTLPIWEYWADPAACLEEILSHLPDASPAKPH